MKRYMGLIGSLICIVMYSCSLVLMLASVAENFYGGQPDVFSLYRVAIIAALVIFSLCCSKRLSYAVLGAAVLAVVVLLLRGWKPLSLFQTFVYDWTEHNRAPHVNTIAAISVIIFMAASLCLEDSHAGVELLGLIAVFLFGIMWFGSGQRVKLDHALPMMLSLSGMYALEEEGSFIRLKVLLTYSLIAALLASVLVPDKSVAWEPLQQAGQKTMRFLVDTFNLDRNQAEQRRPFNLVAYGWRQNNSDFGGPAYPYPGELLKVETEYPVYLRGSIRYTYTGRAWVDESNSDKVGKIHRYMMNGVEGLLYKSEYERAMDLDKTAALQSFVQTGVDVTLLDDGHPYWSLYSPGRTIDVSTEGDFRVFYNNLGEVFASRKLENGDSYHLDTWAFIGSEELLRETVIDCAGQPDEALKQVLLLNREVPDGVDPRLYALVYDITSGLEQPFDIACALRDHLLMNGVYTLRPDPVPAGKDFVSYFVLEDMRGYCMYYAASMALMARIAGLPARYVEGYHAEPGASGQCILTGENAHAWAEVYFEGFGWLPFEATSSNMAGEEDDSQNSGSNPPGIQTPDATPAPTPTPSPTPAPQPTPDPSNWVEPPESDETPSPEGDIWPDAPDSWDPPDTPPDGGQTEEEDPQDEEAGAQSDAAPPLWLLIVLPFVLLIALCLLVWLRVKRTHPQQVEKRYAKTLDRMLIWYRACLMALESAGLDYTDGYTPVSCAQKAVELGLAGNAFVRYSDMLARQRYGQKRVDAAWRELARESYEDILRRMPRARRHRFLIRRALRGLGSPVQVP